MPRRGPAIRKACNVEISVSIKQAAEEAIANVRNARRERELSSGPNITQAGAKPTGPGNHLTMAEIANRAVDFTRARFWDYITTVPNIPHEDGPREQVTLNGVGHNIQEKLKPIRRTRFDLGLERSDSVMWRPVQECMRLYLLWNSKSFGLLDTTITNHLAVHAAGTPAGILERIVRAQDPVERPEESILSPAPSLPDDKPHSAQSKSVLVSDLTDASQRDAVPET